MMAAFSGVLEDGAGRLIERILVSRHLRRSERVGEVASEQNSLPEWIGGPSRIAGHATIGLQIRAFGVSLDETSFMEAKERGHGVGGG
jgi:hypothetical protein